MWAPRISIPQIIRAANYPYYHYIEKKYISSHRELQWQKMQFRELIEPRIEKAITVLQVSIAYCLVPLIADPIAL